MKNIKLYYEDILEFDGWGDYEIYTDITTVDDLPKHQSMKKVIQRGCNKKVDFDDKDWDNRSSDDKTPWYYARVLTKNANGKNFNDLLNKYRKRFPKSKDLTYFYTIFNFNENNRRTKYCKYIVVNGIICKNLEYFKYKKATLPKLRVNGMIYTYDLRRKDPQWKKLHKENEDRIKKESRKYYKYSFYPWVALKVYNKLENKQKRHEKQKRLWEKSNNLSLFYSKDMLQWMKKQNEFKKEKEWIESIIY